MELLKESGGGYLTSTSIMANMPFAEYAVSEAVRHNIKCVGLHTNLTVGKPVIENPNLTDENGVFLYNRKQIDENPRLTYQDVYDEIKAQIKKVEECSGGKLKIDHIDAHHHLEDNENIGRAIYTIAKEMKLPVRNLGFSKDLKKPDVLFHDFTIKSVKLDTIKNMLAKYENTDLVVELVTHSGYVDEYTKSVTSYLGREKELSVLKQAKEQGIFEGVELISFSEI